ncbi:MAG: fumarylacetoacetase [Gemmatimonadaceae bacterium]|jgi:fumarylacetoacetase|nr:fumarylacetoacetase [Gemmatimonadaceae bacterium]
MTGWPAPDHTHDPTARSWVESANEAGADFPLQNLPFGVYRRAGARMRPRVGVAIGDQVLDVVGAAGVVPMPSAEAFEAAAACDAPTLNRLASLGPVHWRALRHALFELLSATGRNAEAARAARGRLLVPQAEVELLLPVAVGDYTDFYASVHHATNVGSMFRPDQPLLPNYKWVPIGYHGRASSIVVSGTPVRRPQGQVLPEGATVPAVQPTARLDYELELGFLVGPGNAIGTPIPIETAPQHLFGVVLVNDWSARDVQAWEYQPLGPFLAKNFATTISPWVVTLEALAPFRGAPAPRAADDPSPLAYLHDPHDQAHGMPAVMLEVALSTAAMRERGEAPHRVSQVRFDRAMYWTPAQLLTHHASGGCPMAPGDLLASGTVSGPAVDERGCLLERTWRGRDPLPLPDGEVRRFLVDGDEVVIRGWAEVDGAVRIGFGACRGVVRPA